MAKKNNQVESVEEQKPAASTPKKTSNAAEVSVVKVVLPGLSVLVLLVLLTQAGIVFFADKALDGQRNTLVRVYQQHYATAINLYLQNHEAQVQSVSDADLLTHFTMAAPDDELRSRFSGALSVSVTPVVQDPSAPSTLSFAHQDLVARVAAGKKVVPEISFFDNGTVREQVVSFARAIKNDAQQTAAILVVSFPFKSVENALKSFAPDAGRIELIQHNGSEKASIFSGGEGNVERAIKFPTKNPQWELSFAPSDSLSPGRIERMIILGLGIFAAIVAGLIFFRNMMSLQRAIKDDVAAVDEFCGNYFRFGNRQRPLLHLDIFSLLVIHLEQYGTELRAGKPTKAMPVDDLGDLSLAHNAASTLLGDSAPAPLKELSKTVGDKSAKLALNAEIFRAYDVRGVVGDALNEEVARALGQAIGSEAQARGESTVTVGRDGRLSGPELSAALIDGLRASGCDVIDVGMVPTPVLYFAAKTIGTGSGVMVTGSHNPGNYNGFKIMLAGDTLAGDEIQALRTRIEAGNFASGHGGLSQQSVAQDYIDRVSADIALARPVRVVVDAGNGVAGAIGTRALEALGCEVIPLFCDIDGNFPNHHPDPSKPENLKDLIAAVAENNADIGIAYDGDGDRIGVVTAAGKSIFPDRLMMLYAKHVLTTNPGADIIFDVKCTRDLRALITSLGGRPVMCKTGHSFIKAKLKETGAALAGEMSGHIFFNDRWFGFDDAIYAAGRLLEILSLEANDADAVFAEFPENPATPEINIAVSDARKFELIAAVTSAAAFPNANVITIDGLRVEFADSWGLIRASNTTPCLVARFEGKTPAALAGVQAKFKDLLLKTEPSLDIPF